MGTALARSVEKENAMLKLCASYIILMNARKSMNVRNAVVLNAMVNVLVISAVLLYVEEIVDAYYAERSIVIGLMDASALNVAV